MEHRNTEITKQMLQLLASGCSVRTWKWHRNDKRINHNLNDWRRLRGVPAPTIPYANIAHINADPEEAHEALLASLILEGTPLDDDTQPQTYAEQLEEDMVNILFS